MKEVSIADESPMQFLDRWTMACTRNSGAEISIRDGEYWRLRTLAGTGGARLTTTYMHHIRWTVVLIWIEQAKVKLVEDIARKLTA